MLVHSDSGSHPFAFTTAVNTTSILYRTTLRQRQYSSFSTMFSKPSFVSALILAIATISSVNAHGALVAITGSNGVNGQGFGIVESTPRDGTRREPFQVSIFAHIPCHLSLFVIHPRSRLDRYLDYSRSRNFERRCRPMRAYSRRRSQRHGRTA